MNKKKIRLAVVNTLFDGSGSCETSVFKWLAIHLFVFWGLKNKLKKIQQKNRDHHPVKKIIQKYEPDVMVLNEVINNNENNSLEILKQAGYEYQPKKISSDLKTITIVASKIPAEFIKMKYIKMPERFQAIKINPNILIIGCHPHAFFYKKRRQQINKIFEIYKNNKNLNIIMAGDFNSKLENKFEKIPNGLIDITAPSYPSLKIMKKINALPYIVKKILKYILSINKGQKAIDHVLIPEKFKLSQLHCVETCSDHLALVADIIVK